MTMTWMDEECWIVANWLSYLNFEEKHDGIFATQTDRTGQWLLKSQDFKDWVKGKSSIL